MYELALGLFGGMCGWLFFTYMVAQHRFGKGYWEVNGRTFYAFLLFGLLVFILPWVDIASLRWLTVEWFMVYGGMVGCIVYSIEVFQTVQRQDWSLKRMLLLRRPNEETSSVWEVRVGAVVVGASCTLMFLIILLHPCTWLDRTLGLSGCRVALAFDEHFDEFAIAPTDAVVAVSVADAIVFVDLHTGKQQKLNGLPYKPRSLRWSADGQQLMVINTNAVPETGGTVLVVEYATQTIVEQFSIASTLAYARATSDMQHMAIGLDAELRGKGANSDLATAPAAGRYMVNRVDDQKSVLALRSVDDPTVVYNWTIRTYILDLALTADGTMAVLDGGDTLYIWDLP